MSTTPPSHRDLTSGTMVRPCVGHDDSSPIVRDITSSGMTTSPSSEPRKRPPRVPTPPRSTVVVTPGRSHRRRARRLVAPARCFAFGGRREPARLRRGVHRDGRAAAARPPVRLPPAQDSHPPLDYLIRLPSHGGVDELWFRMPSVVCSVLRSRSSHGGCAGMAWPASSPRDARVQLLPADPRSDRRCMPNSSCSVSRRRCSPTAGSAGRAVARAALGALVVLTCSPTSPASSSPPDCSPSQASGRDREAWRWRAGIAPARRLAVLGAVVPRQAQGGHSDWIPRTTLDGIVHTFGRLVAYDPQLHVIALAAVIAGAVGRLAPRSAVGTRPRVLRIRARRAAAAAGVFAPVLLDRTLTVAAWGPLLAIGFLVGGIGQRTRRLWACSRHDRFVVVPAAVHVVETRSGPDRALRHLALVVRPGDVVTTHPGGKLPEPRGRSACAAPTPCGRFP